MPPPIAEDCVLLHHKFKLFQNMSQNQHLKPPVEVSYQKELEALATHDKAPKPATWKLSPQAVRTFILGAEKPLVHKGEEITISRKFFGNDALIERCIVTLAGNRGLMLVGEPGTAKTMLSELLSAAICGTTAHTIQGTAAVTEDMIKYSWNYALLLAKGPVPEALVPSPLYVGMRDGLITRFEEITRCPAETQDALVSVLSDKVMTIPELGQEGHLYAKAGFNLIATANTRDKGVNEMSAALKRRFNFETVRPISNVNLEAKIIEQESMELLRSNGIEPQIDTDLVGLLATTFQELREGVTKEGHRVESPFTVMSTAEAVSVYYQSALSAHYYGEEAIAPERIVENLVGAVLKENEDDLGRLKAYFDVVIKQRAISEEGLWKKYYEASGRLK